MIFLLSQILVELVYIDLIMLGNNFGDEHAQTVHNVPSFINWTSFSFS